MFGVRKVSQCEAQQCETQQLYEHEHSTSSCTLQGMQHGTEQLWAGSHFCGIMIRIPANGTQHYKRSAARAFYVRLSSNSQFISANAPPPGIRVRPLPRRNFLSKNAFVQDVPAEAVSKPMKKLHLPTSAQVMVAATAPPGDSDDSPATLEDSDPWAAVHGNPRQAVGTFNNGRFVPSSCGEGAAPLDTSTASSMCYSSSPGPFAAGLGIWQTTAPPQLAAEAAIGQAALMRNALENSAELASPPPARVRAQLAAQALAASPPSSPLPARTLTDQDLDIDLGSADATEPPRPQHHDEGQQGRTSPHARRPDSDLFKPTPEMEAAAKARRESGEVTVKAPVRKALAIRAPPPGARLPFLANPARRTSSMSVDSAIQSGPVRQGSILVRQRTSDGSDVTSEEGLTTIQV